MRFYAGFLSGVIALFAYLHQHAAVRKRYRIWRRNQRSINAVKDIWELPVYDREDRGTW